MREEEDGKRPLRKRHRLVDDATRLVNRMKGPVCAFAAGHQALPLPLKVPSDRGALEGRKICRAFEHGLSRVVIFSHSGMPVKATSPRVASSRIGGLLDGAPRGERDEHDRMMPSSRMLA